MSMETKRILEKRLLLAVKIAVGSAAAVYIAEALHLEYAVSAGTVTLLTLMGTKWETVKLSVIRLGTFMFTVALAFLIIPRIRSEWIAYTVILFIVVFVLALLGWNAALSINFVIIGHYIYSRDFSFRFFCNELLLVLIGVVIAFLFNLFHLNKKRKKDIMEEMRYTEQKLQYILQELSGYLQEKEMSGDRSVWEDICTLEKKLKGFRMEAREYQNNNFAACHAYYADYFEMRLEQCRILNSLHYEMKKIRTVPKQAKVVADYICYMAECLSEKNVPKEEMERLYQMLEDMKQEELPVTREEFENCALLYHVIMDLEEFLKYKIAFVDALDEEQKKAYWD